MLVDGVVEDTAVFLCFLEVGERVALQHAEWGGVCVAGEQLLLDL